MCVCVFVCMCVCVRTHDCALTYSLRVEAMGMTCDRKCLSGSGLW